MGTKMSYMGLISLLGSWLVSSASVNSPPSHLPPALLSSALCPAVRTLHTSGRPWQAQSWLALLISGKLCSHSGGGREGVEASCYSQVMDF